MATNPTLLPYMDGLSLPDLSQLINDPLLHKPTWPPMPTKIPSNIPMFEGNPGEYLTKRVSLSTCGVHQIPSLRTPFIFYSSNIV